MASSQANCGDADIRILGATTIAKPVTLITGASSGIGAAFARIFAQHGHELVLLARRQARLDAVADAIAARGGERPHVIAIDLGRDGAAPRVAALLVARDVEPEIVVNNAGFGLVGSAAELDREAQLAMIDLDIRVLTDLSLRFIEPMARHRGGLLNVASLAGFLPGPGMAVYFACKAYVLSFTQSLHRELAPSGIKVTALCPGPIRTEFFARAGVAADKLPRVFMRSAERAAREGYEGFMKGRPLVVPGAINKIAAAAPGFLPRSLLRSMVAAVGSNLPLLPTELP
jgi:uncharacterized protein